MKQLLSFLGSMKTMAVLMLVFAVAIGYATIIENDYGTLTAKAEIYNAKWFEVLLGLLAVNLVLNIYNYKMYTLKKAPIFIFHIAFLVILFGAAVTRFVGFEGTMHIREGESSSKMLSHDTYFNIDALNSDKKVSFSEGVYLSKKSLNRLDKSFMIDGKKVSVEMVEYIPDAVEQSVADEDGDAVAEMMVAGADGAKTISLKMGEYFETSDIVIDFASSKTFTKPVISLYVDNDALFMKHTMPLSYMKMSDRSTGELAINNNEPFATRTLFGTGETNFVLRQFLPHAITKIVSNPNAKAKMAGIDALRFKISVDEASKEVLVFGKDGVLAEGASVNIDGVSVNVSYGAKYIELPFAIKLKDFQLDRYPGSMSPASYASEVELIDDEEKVYMPYRIFMNNILEHRGYRFFQSSYDQDEKGTILSVNNDPGTLPSYIGYALLALGMFWSLFSKNHRFSKLAARAKKASEEKMLPILVACGILFSLTPAHAEELNPAIKTILSFDTAHAKKFSELVVQDSGGRMKPLDTLSHEILAKLYRGAFVQVGPYALNSNQVILGMIVRPDIYRNMKIISTNDEEVNKLIGTEPDAKYASFSQFFEDPDGIKGYKLAQKVDEASRKAPKDQNKLDKKLLQIDERVNIAYMVFTGSLVKIWPKANDASNKWFATIEALQSLELNETSKIKNLAVDYFTAVDDATQSGNWSEADDKLAKIAEFQKFYGAAVYPAEGRIKAEVFYNNANIFETIYPIYLLLGFVLLVLSFVKILKPKFKLEIYSKTTLIFLVLLFIAHTIGLTIRWYISGHAPWSDGYESMIYIGWATVLAGFIFSKRSSITMASTGILAGLILFVAHLNWMNPQVTNLVPVLNSYWLSIHVSMITASYGFLGLGALLGFITIILFIVKNPSNEKHISLSIKELNAINEMSLMVGLVLLTVGNFLGGVWANESWGRYWGWDPKETWALVTILVYAVVVHLRFIKSLYTEFSYSVISLLAFTSVIMTYFGVNYYLAGLHSYAKGDPVPIPDFVPISYLIIFIVIALAYRNRKLA